MMGLNQPPSPGVRVNSRNFHPPEKSTRFPRFPPSPENGCLHGTISLDQPLAHELGTTIPTLPDEPTLLAAHVRNDGKDDDSEVG